jgi:hypothetical protein
LDSGCLWDIRGIVGSAVQKRAWIIHRGAGDVAERGETVLFAEDLLLLVLDGETGWTMVSDVSTGLAGAVLIEQC